MTSTETTAVIEMQGIERVFTTNEIETLALHDLAVRGSLFKRDATIPCVRRPSHAMSQRRDRASDEPRAPHDVAAVSRTIPWHEHCSKQRNFA